MGPCPSCPLLLDLSPLLGLTAVQGASFPAVSHLSVLRSFRESPPWDHSHRAEPGAGAAEALPQPPRSPDQSGSASPAVGLEGWGALPLLSES